MKSSHREGKKEIVLTSLVVVTEEQRRKFRAYEGSSGFPVRFTPSSQRGGARVQSASTIMSATSGIGVSSELSQKFSEAVESKSIRFIKVSIRNGAVSYTRPIVIC